MAESSGAEGGSPPRRGGGHVVLTAAAVLLLVFIAGRVSGASVAAAARPVTNLPAGMALIVGTRQMNTGAPHTFDEVLQCRDAFARPAERALNAVVPEE